jgi:signal transduction histidine kinase
MMSTAGPLQEAFSNFTAASRSLEATYLRLKEEVRYLTEVLEETNQRLSRALAEAEETKDFLNGILQSLEEAIIVLDHRERVIMLNRAAERLLERSASEVIGGPFPQGDGALQERDGETFWVSSKKQLPVIVSRTLVRDGEGTIRGYVLSIQDISRLKELETRQERNKRLIAMGEMAAKLVHEIRNPLCSIELYSSMLAADLADSRYADLARGISQGISSLNHVLTNMHFFAVPQRPVFAEVDFAQAVDELSFMLRPLVEGKRIRLRKGYEAGVRLCGDKELIKQALLNILLNAVEASPEAGVVDLDLRRGSSGEMIVEVRDQGPGVPVPHLERIFDPFFSLKEKGSGLGLSIAANIMQAHGGTIRVENRENGGACFQMIFPTASQPRDRSAEEGQREESAHASR